VRDPIDLCNCAATAVALIYNQIMSSVLKKESLLAFIDGKAGRGKTFLINAICDKVCSLRRIVILTTIAAFAAQLYPGGHTIHSAFKVYSCLPLSVLHTNLIHITLGSSE